MSWLDSLPLELMIRWLLYLGYGELALAHGVNQLHRQAVQVAITSHARRWGLSEDAGSRPGVLWLLQMQAGMRDARVATYFDLGLVVDKDGACWFLILLVGFGQVKALSELNTSVVYAWRKRLFARYQVEILRSTEVGTCQCQ